MLAVVFPWWCCCIKAQLTCVRMHGRGTSELLCSMQVEASGPACPKQCEVQGRSSRQDPNLFLKHWFTCWIGFSGSCPAFPCSSEGHHYAPDWETPVTTFKATTQISQGAGKLQDWVYPHLLCFQALDMCSDSISLRLLSQDVGHYQILCSFIYFICMVCSHGPLRIQMQNCGFLFPASSIASKHFPASHVVILGSSLIRLGSISPFKGGTWRQ